MKTNFSKSSILLTALSTGLLFMAPTASAEPEVSTTSRPDKVKRSQQLEMHDSLVAIIHPASGSNVQGSVLFERVKRGVKVTAKIGGLEPGSQHGIHIHEFGDISKPDGTSAGGHYNPEGHNHALPDTSQRHAGDLGNLTAGDDGNAQLVLTVDNVSLSGRKNPIIGRAVVIHSDKDDGSQPSGNAGDRIGIGVIGIGQSDKPTEPKAEPDLSPKPALGSDENVGDGGAGNIHTPEDNPGSGDAADDAERTPRPETDPRSPDSEDGAVPGESDPER